MVGPGPEPELGDITSALPGVGQALTCHIGDKGGAGILHDGNTMGAAAGMCDFAHRFDIL